MNLNEFIPMFIRQDENMRPKGVVTAARWNELWDMSILQGDHSEEALQTLVAEVLNRYTKLEADALLAGNTNDLVKTVDVNLANGVITITKKDGTVTTFDTALEKVPATFTIIESAGKYYLKITNVDGTTSQTDLTNLMDVYNYNNTATVSFVKSGTGNVKTITAEVRDASIGLEKLSITAISQIESWANTASNGAATATTQANTATTKATEAAASAVTASSKATEASGSAQTATNKAGEASTSAANALSSANSAAASASTATTKASEAAASATAANTSKTQAATSATNAATSEANALVSKNAAAASATDANTKATQAGNSATAASGSAAAAATSAQEAAASAVTANTKAGEAHSSATNAAASAASAQGIDTLSRSYAVGGTGTRPGEDTDNAKYYKDQAAAIVGGDYVTQTDLTNGLATKVDTVAGKQLSTEDYTTAEKTKLGTVATNANNYVHPTTAGNKHIPTGGSVGQILKNTASGTATWQAEYSHPATHPASIIVQDANNRFMTDAERNKLSGIEVGATNYQHPANHAPSIISQDANNRFVTDAQIAAWNSKADAGLTGKTTVFNADGSITETLAGGSTLVTVFNGDGSITETLTVGGVSTVRTTTFSGNTITEVIS